MPGNPGAISFAFLNLNTSFSSLTAINRQDDRTQRLSPIRPTRGTPMTAPRSKTWLAALALPLMLVGCGYQDPYAAMPLGSNPYGTNNYGSSVAQNLPPTLPPGVTPK